MVPGSSAALWVIATVLLAAVPAGGVPASGIADFLTTMGGDTDLKTSGSMLSNPSPQLYSLSSYRSEIIDYRFFAEKLTANGSATAERAQAAFAQECTAKCDRIEPEDVTLPAVSESACCAAGCRYGTATSISGRGCRRCVPAARPRSWAASSRSRSITP